MTTSPSPKATNTGTDWTGRPRHNVSASHTGRDGFGIVVAAGSGRRFGSPKQFARIARRPMLEYSIRAFEECRDITGYVVVTRESDVRRMERIARRVRAARLIAVVIGGRHRADSVRNGLDRLPEQGWVAVHDAARPMVTPGMLSAGASLARRGLAAVFARPVNDTLKRGTPKRLHATVSREGLYLSLIHI